MLILAIDPRTTSEIKDQIESDITNSAVSITDFLATSFNKIWSTAFSDALHEIEVRALVAQLSGWAQYAGRTNLDETDLERLGVDGADPEEVNELMEPSHLDELAEIVGIERDPGQKATGEITVQTATEDTRVPEGMEVATEPDVDGNQLIYLVDADSDGEIEDTGFVTPNTGSTQVTVDVIAESIGDKYNVGAGSVTRLPSPPVGVEGVTNQTEISGGNDEQSTGSYREDVTNAPFEGSDGGTEQGIEGFVENEVDGVIDVEIDEFTGQQPPFVDVIVDGGSDGAVVDAISDSRPTGVEHNLVRPESVQLGVETTLVGTDIDLAFVENQVESLLTDLTINGDFSRSTLIQQIQNSDIDILDIGSLRVLLSSVVGESNIQEAGTDIYTLDFEPFGRVTADEVFFDVDQDVYRLAYDKVDDTSITVEAIVNDEDVTLTEGTDYDVIDDDGDSDLDSIDFSIGGDNPDNRTVVSVEYNHGSWAIDSTIEDEDGVIYDKGTDWDLIDDDSDGLQDSIDWSIGGTQPSDGTRWTTNYEPKKTIRRDLALSQQEKISAGSPIDANKIDPDRQL